MKKVVSSGISGLDRILDGGMVQGSTIIVEGAPGTGKTTFGLQFLVHGAMHEDEPGIYITFEELPEQLYEEALSFGWDLRHLEKKDLLRVVCMSPEVFLEQMTEPKGILEQLVTEIDSKRIVIDSISLFEYMLNSKERHRQAIYQMRNTLRKWLQTSILIQEQAYADASEVPFEHYIADGVIRLSLKEHMGKYRKRKLEVLKMRGKKIIEGEHIYRITDQGIYLVPALTMVEDVTITRDVNMVTTGIPKLDQILNGGIPRGSIFIVDTNGKANYKFLVGSILAERLRSGEKALIFLSSLTPIEEVRKFLQLFEICLEKKVKRKQVFFIEHYDRPVPAEFEEAVIKATRMSDQEYQNLLRNQIGPMMQESIRRGEHWFVYYDLNTIVNERGKEYVIAFFAEEAAKKRALGMTGLVLCNFKEIGEETASFLERTCNGVIHTWVDGTYQYLQVTKSPYGNMSMPLLVENTHEIPYIRLI